MPTVIRGADEGPGHQISGQTVDEYAGTTDQHGDCPGNEPSVLGFRRDIRRREFGLARIGELFEFLVAVFPIFAGVFDVIHVKCRTTYALGNHGEQIEQCPLRSTEIGLVCIGHARCGRSRSARSRSIKYGFDEY